MLNPAILALQTGVPEHCYETGQISEVYAEILGVKGQRRERTLQTIMNYSGVKYRYSAAPPEFFMTSHSTQYRNDLYMEAAVPLGRQVIAAGLEKAGIDARDIDTFMVVSCTGFSIPGLDLLLAGELGMKSSLNRSCILGMGCYGAFPGVRRAVENVQAKDGGLALVLALELCTLHMQFDNTAESVVSTSLFADGAAMVVLGDSPTAAGPRVIDSETFCDYKTLDHMSFTVTDEGFRMYLSSYVPDVLAANIEGFVDGLLARNDLTRDGVKYWLIHPGSEKIVRSIQAKLGLGDEQVQASLDVLEHYGNMSSATILFVLDRVMQDEAPQPGDCGVMMAFGPGLTMEGMLVRW